MGLYLNGDSQKSQIQFHVLAVDDNLIERKLLERLLTNSSYQVTCVESGHKALKYLGLHDDSENSHSYAAAYTSSSSPQQERLKVNLILTDFCMPGMSGYDLLTRLKKSSWKDVPVVVMSSENVPSRINMCLEGGAEEFLLKPLQLSDLNKIQPHLLKSLHYSTTSINREFTNIAQDYKGKNNLKISNNSAIKRKAVKAVSPQPSERRSKMKELVG